MPQVCLRKKQRLNSEFIEFMLAALRDTLTGGRKLRLKLAVSYEKVGNGTMGARSRGELCGRGYRPVLDGRAADGFRVAAARGEREL